MSSRARSKTPLRGRIDFEGATARFGGLNMTASELRGIGRIVIAATGTSWHAALVGEYLIEELAHLPVEVEFAHEFYNRNAPLERDTVLLVISQSGETADTLGALREAKRRGHRVLSICNVVGSTVAREADGGIYMHAGPEIGVASTKAFVSMLVVLSLLGVHLGRMRMLSVHRALEILRGLEALPGQIGELLRQAPAIQKLALKYAQARDFFFLSRGYNFPIALEGALKLKEISYIHAEGYSAAEMKHGPIALVDSGTPAVFVVPQDAMYEKTLANLAMIRARKGPIIAVATEGDAEIGQKADDVILFAADPGAALSDPGHCSAATVRLLHRRRARLRRGQAAQPGQERDSGVEERPALSWVVPQDQFKVAKPDLRFAIGIKHEFSVAIKRYQEMVRFKIEVLQSALREFCRLCFQQFLRFLARNQAVGAGMPGIERGIEATILCGKQFIRSIPIAPNGDVIAIIAHGGFAVRSQQMAERRVTARVGVGPVGSAAASGHIYCARINGLDAMARELQGE